MKGKHVKKASHIWLKLRMPLAAIAILVMVTAGASGAFAWLKDNTGEVKNIFTPSKVDCDVDEDFENNIKENVSIKNTGDTEAYIRVALVFTWKNNDGNGVAAWVPVQGEDYDISLNTSDWIKGDDGFYYCKTPIAPEGFTPVLINNCTVKTQKQGCSLQLEIVSSALQSEPSGAATEAWGVTIEKGIITKGGTRR